MPETAQYHKKPNIGGLPSLLYKNQLFMSPEEKEDMISTLMRNLATLEEQMQGRAAESSVFLPEGVGEARRRGISYQTSLAGQEGITGIERYAKEVNRDATKFLLNQQLQRWLMKESQPTTADYIMSAIGEIGGASGYAVGAGLL